MTASAHSGVLRVCYADPPYIGQAKKHYKDDARCAEVDHGELIGWLNRFDAWALSASSPSLQQILALCPNDVRIGAWVKPFCAFKANVNPAYAWKTYCASPRLPLDRKVTFPEELLIGGRFGETSLPAR